MKKVLVIGCPGSGKSTFARRLRDRTGLPLYPLDLLWHRPDKTTVSEAEFDAALAENSEKRPLDHRRQLQPDAGTATGGMRHGISFRSAACGLHCGRGSAHRYKRAKICRGSRRSSTRNSRVYHAFFPEPGFPTSMRCWKSTGIKRSPYFIPAPSVKSIKYQRRKPDDSTLEDRYERNKPNRPFRPAVRGA